VEAATAGIIVATIRAATAGMILPVGVAMKVEDPVATLLPDQAAAAPMAMAAETVGIAPLPIIRQATQIETASAILTETGMVETATVILIEITGIVIGTVIGTGIGIGTRIGIRTETSTAIATGTRTKTRTKTGTAIGTPTAIATTSAIESVTLRSSTTPKTMGTTPTA